jgi:hypothetical protein
MLHVGMLHVVCCLQTGHIAGRVIDGSTATPVPAVKVRLPRGIVLCGMHTPTCAASRVSAWDALPRGHGPTSCTFRMLASGALCCHRLSRAGRGDAREQRDAVPHHLNGPERAVCAGPRRHGRWRHAAALCSSTSHCGATRRTAVQHVPLWCNTSCCGATRPFPFCSFLAGIPPGAYTLRFEKEGRITTYAPQSAVPGTVAIESVPLCEHRAS